MQKDERLARARPRQRHVLLGWAARSDSRHVALQWIVNELVILYCDGLAGLHNLCVNFQNIGWHVVEQLRLQGLLKLFVDCNCRTSRIHQLGF